MLAAHGVAPGAEHLRDAVHRLARFLDQEDADGEQGEGQGGGGEDQDGAGGWVLNGAKKWIGNGAAGGITIVWARDTEDGQVKGFVVEQSTPGYEAEVITGKGALRAIH